MITTGTVAIAAANGRLLAAPMLVVDQLPIIWVLPPTICTAM